MLRCIWQRDAHSGISRLGLAWVSSPYEQTWLSPPADQHCKVRNIQHIADLSAALQASAPGCIDEHLVHPAHSRADRVQHQAQRLAHSAALSS